MAKAEALREMLLTMCVQVEQSEAAAMRMLATVDAQLRTVDVATAAHTTLELELATFRSKWASEPDILLLEPIVAVRQHTSAHLNSARVSAGLRLHPRAHTTDAAGIGVCDAVHTITLTADGWDGTLAHSRRRRLRRPSQSWRRVSWEPLRRRWERIKWYGRSHIRPPCARGHGSFLQPCCTRTSSS
jgi:hypothetical protein